MKLLLINQSARLDVCNNQLVLSFEFVDENGICYRDTKYTPLPDDFSKSALHDYAKGHVESLTRLQTINPEDYAHYFTSPVDNDSNE